MTLRDAPPQTLPLAPEPPTFLRPGISRRPVEVVRSTNGTLVKRYHFLTQYERDSFFAEAISLHRLGHPNIPALLAVGYRGDRGWLQLPDCGVDLRVYLEQHSVGVSEVLSISLDVIDSQVYALEQGIEHGDLSSGNVVVALGSDRPRATVIDWGAAILQELPERRALGTHGFIPPRWNDANREQRTSFQVGVLVSALFRRLPSRSTRTTRILARAVAEDPDRRPRLRELADALREEATP